MAGSSPSPLPDEVLDNFEVVWQRRGADVAVRARSSEGSAADERVVADVAAFDDIEDLVMFAEGVGDRRTRATDRGGCTFDGPLVRIWTSDDRTAAVSLGAFVRLLRRFAAVAIEQSGDAALRARLEAAVATLPE